MSPTDDDDDATGLARSQPRPERGAARLIRRNNGKSANNHQHCQQTKRVPKKCAWHIEHLVQELLEVLGCSQSVEHLKPFPLKLCSTAHVRRRNRKSANQHLFRKHVSDENTRTKLNWIEFVRSPLNSSNQKRLLTVMRVTYLPAKAVKSKQGELPWVPTSVAERMLNLPSNKSPDTEFNMYSFHWNWTRHHSHKISRLEDSVMLGAPSCAKKSERLSTWFYVYQKWPLIMPELLSSRQDMLVCNYMLLLASTRYDMVNTPS
jgi:hypothetical protein